MRTINYKNWISELQGVTNPPQAVTSEGPEVPGVYPIVLQQNGISMLRPFRATETTNTSMSKVLHDEFYLPPWKDNSSPFAKKHKRVISAGTAILKLPIAETRSCLESFGSVPVEIIGRKGLSKHLTQALYYSERNYTWPELALPSMATLVNSLAEENGVQVLVIHWMSV